MFHTDLFIRAKAKISFDLCRSLSLLDVNSKLHYQEPIRSDVTLAFALV